MISLDSMLLHQIGVAHFNWYIMHTWSWRTNTRFQWSMKCWCISKCIKQTWHVTICDRSAVNMRQEEEWDQAQFWHHVDCSLVSVVKSCNIDEMRPRVSAALVITSICISVGCYARLQTVEAPDYKQNFSSHHSLVKDYYCSWFQYWPWPSLVADTEHSSDDDGVAYDGRRQQCKQRVMVSQAAAVVLSGWVITGSSS